MSANTGIEWTDATWNPVRGCTRVSEGCRNCYAETLAARDLPGMRSPTTGDPFARRTPSGPRWTGKVELIESKLSEPLRWKKPRRVFVNSMSDLFHEGLSDEAIDRVFAAMAWASRHTYQILTKRPERMARYVNGIAALGKQERAQRLALSSTGRLVPLERCGGMLWPLRNVWLGVSVENQAAADERIPLLLQTPAAVRFLSCEPLLGPLDLNDMWVQCSACGGSASIPVAGGGKPCGFCIEPYQGQRPGVDWVIAGGESGPGARPMHPNWARSLRDQCAHADVPFFFKQWGEYLPAAIEDDATFEGGRAFDSPVGGRHSASMRYPSRKPFQSGETVMMKPGDENGVGAMLDQDTMAVRVGKKRAGRELDGRTWDEFPRSTA